MNSRAFKDAHRFGDAVWEMLDQSVRDGVDPVGVLGALVGIVAISCRKAGMTREQFIALLSRIWDREDVRISQRNQA